MKLTRAQAVLSMYGAASEKRAEAIATELRAAFLLPKGGRGYNAPDVSCEQVALFALAVAGAERVTDAVDAARSLAAMVNSQGIPLHEELSDLICGEVPNNVQALRVMWMTNARMAELAYRDGKVEYFFPAHDWEVRDFVPEHQGQGFAGRIGHIGGGVISQLCLEMDETDEDNTGRIVA